MHTSHMFPLHLIPINFDVGRQTYANVSNIKPGVYVLKLFLETGKTATTRFIVK
ncbi:MAG: hypothetical protein LT105_15485 [Lentimicrobium sp.]|nr:hypothetical protein [Lentimicrobium sp.]